MFNIFNQLKIQDWLTGLVLFLALLIAVGVGFSWGQKTASQVSQAPSLGQATGLEIARGQIKGLTDKEIVLEVAGKTQKFQITAETRVTLLTLPKIELPVFATETAQATIPPPPPLTAPPQPKEIKITDLKVGDDVSLVYKIVDGQAVVQSISVSQEAK